MKGLEKLKDLYARASVKTEIKNLDIILKDYDTIEKELKALKIIKKRECLYKGLQEVSQEECELLNEVGLL